MKKGGETKVSNQEVPPLEQEILDATSQESKHMTESDQKYFDRLRKAISEMEDEKWNCLSATAQAWYNKSSDII